MLQCSAVEKSSHADVYRGNRSGSESMEQPSIHRLLQCIIFPSASRVSPGPLSVSMASSITLDGAKLLPRITEKESKLALWPIR